MNSTTKSFKSSSNLFKKPEINVNDVCPGKLNRHKQSFNDKIDHVDPKFEERSSQVLFDVRFRNDFLSPIDYTTVD